MFQVLRRILTTWPFLVSLLVLLANDTWFKQFYPGPVSGKLSDFAGISVLSLLLLAAFPRCQRLVCGVIITGFVWWKSPLSQPAIDAINLQLSYPIGRVVDYTDLVALIVIPACAMVTSNPAAFALPGQPLRRLLRIPVVALTALGLMATSVVPTRQDFEVRHIDGATNFDHESIAKTVSQLAAEHELDCHDCANPSSSARYIGKGVSLKYAFLGENSVSFKVEAYPDGLFFGASGREKADRVREDLKSRLASTYRNLEYVERLGPKEDGTQ